ncbi:Hypothetical predicted protein, partial [Olea europaea subsp. europaea]
GKQSTASTTANTTSSNNTEKWCKGCQKKHARDYVGCKNTPNTLAQQQNQRIDQLTNKLDRTVLLLEAMRADRSPPPEDDLQAALTTIGTEELFAACEETHHYLRSTLQHAFEMSEIKGHVSKSGMRNRIVIWDPLVTERHMKYLVVFRILPPQ